MTAERKKNDYYRTPATLATYAVHSAYNDFLADRPEVLFLEPGCGETAPFLDAALDLPEVEGVGLELMDKEEGSFSDHLVGRMLLGKDFLEQGPSEYGQALKENKGFDLIIGNPPFSQAERFVERGIELLRDDGVLCYLLRLGFMASRAREKLLTIYKPRHVRVLTPRPSFTGGGTDSQEYALFYWEKWYDGETTLDRYTWK